MKQSPARSAGGGVRSCMRDHIRNALVERIADGVYPPGTRLKELELAAEFNVSQAPVREALRELEAFGLLESERYRGTRVRAVSPDEMRESYELRARLEQAAAELAVPLDAASLDALQQLADATLAAARRGDMERFVRGNIDFHRGIVAAAGNRVLLRVWDSLGWEVRSRMAVRHVAARRPLTAAATAHQQIIAALRDGEGGQAGRLLREHSEGFLGEAAQMDASAAQAQRDVRPARSQSR